MGQNCFSDAADDVHISDHLELIKFTNGKGTKGTSPYSRNFDRLAELETVNCSGLMLPDKDGSNF